MKTVRLDQAAAMIPDGASVMVGGFMGVGTPECMIDEIVSQAKKSYGDRVSGHSQPRPATPGGAPALPALNAHNRSARRCATERRRQDRDGPPGT